MAGQPGTNEIRPAARPPGLARRGSGLTRRDLLWRSAAGAGLLAAGPVLAACSSSTATSSASASASAGTPKRGGTLSFGRQIGPTQLDPANSIVEGDVYTLDKIFEPLYITNPAGQLVPWLAQGHTVSTDGKTWTFALRPGVTFSDGKPVTADDVVFSIKRAAGDANGPLSFLDFAIKSHQGGRHELRGGHLVPAVGAVPVGHLGVRQRHPAANFGGQSETRVLRQPGRHRPVHAQELRSKAATSSLERNPHYWQAGKPYLDAVDFVYVRRRQPARAPAQERPGAGDRRGAAGPGRARSRQQLVGGRCRALPGLAGRPAVLNEKLPQFADRHVRRAINYALNVPASSQATSLRHRQAGRLVLPAQPAVLPADVPTLSYNLSAAKAELAKSKYPHGFSFSLLVSSGNSQYVAAATIIQQQLKPLGIKVTLNQLDDAAFHTAFEAFNYQAMINGATNDISDPDEMASFQVDVKNGGSHSFWTYYDNPSAIALTHQAETEFDDAKRAALYAQIQAIVAQDAPYIPLDYPPNIYAWSPQLHGFAVNPGGAYRLEDVWLG